ncbi:VacJ family lipoprotein [soil metagenome]
MQKLTILSSLFCTILLSGCASTHNPEDPYENFNRSAFKLNDTLDKAFLKPAAQFYKGLVPTVISDRVSNVFNNVASIPTIGNDLLQFDFYHMGRDLTRFVINTTIGLGGLFDPAKCMGLPYHSNDFGLTLAKWGVKDSPYFVIPFLGPSTVRDAIGLVPYYYMTVYPYIKPLSVRYSLLGLYTINYRAELLQVEDLANEIAVDPYVFQRNAYLQNRRGTINGKIVEDSGNDIYVEDTKTPSVQPQQSQPHKHPVKKTVKTKKSRNR